MPANRELSPSSPGTGRDALRVITARPASKTPAWRPALILLDLRLPDMNGVEVVRELRRSQSSVPPVVLLSADSPQVLKNAASSVGAASVRKPFDFNGLFQVIEGALAKVV
jgi:DNA-binding response OmpR family regulator